MKSSYRMMRIFVLFDLPSVTKREKKSYIRFRKDLMDDGFTMLQYSIYTRFCRNIQEAKKHVQRVLTFAPRDGNVRILYVSEEQFEEMLLVIGERSETEKTVGEDYLVVIE